MICLTRTLNKEAKPMQFRFTNRPNRFSSSAMKQRRWLPPVKGEDKEVEEEKAAAEVEKEEDLGKRTESSCNSCAAAAVADVIAVCCCPCVVLNFLALTFFRLPCAAGRSCVRILKKRRGYLEEAGDGSVRKEGLKDKAVVELSLDSVIGMGIPSDRIEEERVWKEMYKVGQWGFGRVSLSISEAEA